MADKKQQYPARVEFGPDGRGVAAPRREPSYADRVASTIANTVGGGIKAAAPISAMAAMLGAGALRNMMQDSSGGEMPKQEQPKGAGAPTRQRQLTSNPKNAAEAYDRMLTALLSGKGPKISFNQLGALAPTVPSPAKPPSIEDVMVAEGYQLSKEMFANDVAEAREADDPEAFRSAYERYQQRIANLRSPANAVQQMLYNMQPDTMD